MQKSITFKKNKHTKSRRTQREKVKSEKGFTLLELIFVMVVTMILSSTLVLPFISSIKQGTRPEIYATATYLAMGEIEEKRTMGYTNAKNFDIGTYTGTIDMVNRSYDLQIEVGYVTHSAGSFSDPPVAAPSSEFIKVIVTIDHDDIPNDVVLWEILAKDFYNANANS